jgi:hypothetical protein
MSGTVTPSIVPRLDTRAALLSAIAPVISDVPIDGLGTVRIKQLSVAETDAARAQSGAGTNASGTDFSLGLVACAVVDEDGKALFGLDDLTPLRASAGQKINKLVDAVLKVNGFRAADEGDAGNV